MIDILRWLILYYDIEVMMLLMLLTYLLNLCLHCMRIIDIISDRDFKFLSSFRKVLAKLGTIDVYTSYHLQIDGQIKVINDKLGDT